MKERPTRLPVAVATIAAAICATLQCFLAAAPACAQESQNPSPMVEHTREHPRREKASPDGSRMEVRPGIVLFIPATTAATASPESLRLLVHCHGGHWLPEVAAEAGGYACLSIQIGSGSGAYARLFADKGSFQQLLAETGDAAKRDLGPVTLTAWSAGCGAAREILRDPKNDAVIERVILLDGIHTSYPDGKPGPLESKLDTAKLAPFIRYAREAIAGRESLFIAHTAIFPGTFASTTETADWMLRELEVARQAVLRWGPMKTQQLSEAAAGSFRLQGFAGHSAPDHVDLLHALPAFLDGGERPNPAPQTLEPDAGSAGTKQHN